MWSSNCLVRVLLISLLSLPLCLSGNMPSKPKAPFSKRYSMRCPGSVPQDGYYYPWAPDAFKSLTHLCAPYFGGCICTDDGKVTCDVEWGMWKVYEPFHEKCLAECICIDHEAASSSGTSSGTKQPADTTWKIPEGYPPYDTKKSSEKGKEIDICPIDGPDLEAGCSSTQAGGTSVSTLQHHTCSGSCWSVARQCSWGDTGACICTAPKVGLFFLASGACAQVLSYSKYGGKVRRDGNQTHPISSLPALNQTNVVVNSTDGLYNITTGERVPCVCNSTYVSYGCCNSATGLVWEDASARLPIASP